jgi:hypothetical protein
MENEQKEQQAQQTASHTDQHKKQEFQKRETDPNNPVAHQEKHGPANQEHDKKSNGASKEETGQNVDSSEQDSAEEREEITNSQGEADTGPNEAKS